MFVDIRGFTTFARVAESVDAAQYLRSAYTRILDRYFDDAAFFKPTGDGLMLVFHIPEDASGQEAIFNDLVSRGIRLVEEFPSLCADDRLITFEVPADVGIGMARGVATRLHADDKTLDYSGRCLNLAARLQNFARPKGLVFQDKFATSILDDTIAALFSEDEVYLRSISADDDLAPIQFTDAWTTIDPSMKIAPSRRGATKYGGQEEAPLREWITRGPLYLLDLPEEPRDPSAVGIRVEHPKVTPGGKRQAGLNTRFSFHGEYREDAGKHYVRIDVTALTARLRSNGVKSTWVVKIRPTYDT